MVLSMIIQLDDSCEMQNCMKLVREPVKLEEWLSAVPLTKNTHKRY